MKVLKYSSMDEVSRIRHRLQVVKEGEAIVGVVGITNAQDDVVDIGPLAVDRKYQVDYIYITLLRKFHQGFLGSRTGRLDHG